jgi:hypothetical protein
MVDCGQGLSGGSSEDGQNGALVRGTTPRLRKMGEGMAVILTGCRRGGRGVEVTRRWWGRNSGGSARCGPRLGMERREEGRGEVRWRAARLSLYIGVEGEAAAGD